MGKSKKQKPEKPESKKKKSAKKSQAGQKKIPKNPRKSRSKKTASGKPPHIESSVEQSAGNALSAPKAKRKDLLQTLAEYDESEANKAIEVTEPDPHSLARGDVPMSVVDHLGELRSRVIKSLILVLVFTICAFVFSDEILAFITRPFTSTGFKLNVFKLTEGFMIRLKASAIVAILVGVPVIMHQVWRFILPAIEKKDRMFSRISLLASILLFYAGVAFVFLFLVPLTVQMLLSFVAKEWISTIGASDYINLVVFFCFIMGLLFELPIILMILTRIGIITPSFLVSKRKYAIVLAFVISAVITPTQDLLTQIVVAVPLIFLYEASIIVSKFTAVRKKKSDFGG